MADARQIVVVEDVFVRTFLKAALERLGHTVTCASPAEATQLIESGKADLLVTNTPSVFAKCGALVPLLYMAAFPDPAEASAFLTWLPLRKPFQTSELIMLVERLLG